MIGSLKRKFVLTASILLFAFTFLLIGAINLFNFYTTTKYVDGIIDIVNENGGMPADMEKQGEGGFLRPINKRSLSQTQYFTVKVNAQGEIVAVNVNCASVTEEEARALAEKALASGKTQGFKDSFRYKMTDASKPFQTEAFDRDRFAEEPKEDLGGEKGEEMPFDPALAPMEGERILTFLDWSDQKDSLVSGIVLSYVIGAAGFAVVVLLLIVFARKAVDPVSESIGAQREFITNVSHEIKTPLTVISGDVDILKMSGVESEWLDSIKEEVKKTRYLVDDLVLLSKMNEENVTLSFEKFDLSAFLEERVASFYSVAQVRGLTIHTDIKADVCVNANRQAISELISILMENALKYCDAEGTVGVYLTANGKTAEYKVTNSYLEPIDQESMSKMFDRYFRTRKARSNADGSGIGLSIAKAITVAHHGEIFATQTEGVFSITAKMNVVDKAKKEEQEA